VELDLAKIQVILQKFSKTTEKKFILSLESTPKLQYKYLALFFEQEQQKGQTEKIEDDLILLLVRRVSQIAPGRIVYTLRALREAQNCPIDGILEVLEEEDCKSGLAYLLEQKGAFEQALKL
jgi:hypothetical protein